VFLPKKVAVDFIIGTHKANFEDYIL